MSIPLMALVWTSTMTDATEVAVLSCLASHANDDGESCFAGIPRIAKLVRRSERTVQRTIDGLERAGWLTVRRGDGAGNLTQYEINVEMLKGCQDVTLLGKTKRVTLRQKRVTLTPKKGDIDDTPLLGRNVLEPKANKNTPLPPGSGGSEGGSLSPLLLTDAADGVMRACGWTDRRVRFAVTAQLRMATGLGEALALAAARMVTAWEQHMEAAADELLRCAPYGPKKFIGLGLWSNPDGWPWDRQKLEMRRGARVGMR